MSMELVFHITEVFPCVGPSATYLDVVTTGEAVEGGYSVGHA